MALKSGGRKLSFDILRGDVSIDDGILLYRSISDPIWESEESLSPADKLNRKKRKNKGSKRKKKKKKEMMMTTMIENSIEEDPITDKSVDAVFDGNHQKSAFFDNSSCVNGLESDYQSYKIQTIICEEDRVSEETETSVRTVHQIAEPDFQKFNRDHQPSVELRQRTVNAGNELDESSANKEENNSGLSSSGQKPEPNGSIVTKLGTAESLDWKRLLAEDPTYLSSVEKSPVNFFIGEMYTGNSLRSTTILGNEKERERVYDTIFRLPWRCELVMLPNFDAYQCWVLRLLGFVSIIANYHAREDPDDLLEFTENQLRAINLFAERNEAKLSWAVGPCNLYIRRQFRRPSAADLSDFSCFIVLICGVALLQQIDISLIYHMIRGQGTIKLYVVYNVLEIFDKLCQNFGGDILQTLFSSAEGLASCSPENMKFWLWRFISDQALAAVSSIIHSFVLLAQAITLSTCIVAHNNALLALLVSNNFAEIKSNVFKRFSKENIHNLVYYDSVERFHISSFVLFVLAQNILEAEGSWFGSFVFNALLVYVCEMIVDIIKHSFIAKFNEIKPITYSRFLEDLCNQTLNIQPEDGRKNLTFIPLAPACVVIRVLAPVYAAHLPYGPLLWRLFWIVLLSTMTYVMLASLKVMIGMGLQKYATWYVNRCRKRKHHLHSD